MSRRMLVVMLLFSALAASPVIAHPGHDEHRFAGGAAHPLTGVDHIVAMLAVGLWAAQIGRKATWLLPPAFVGCVVVGALAGRAGLGLPYVEAGIATSVLVLGLMIAVSLRLPTAAAAACVGGFALFHGHAHGAAFAGSGSWVGYGAGFVLMTAVLQVVGIAAYSLIKAWTSELFIRLAGGTIAAAGFLLIARL